MDLLKKMSQLDRCWICRNIKIWIRYEITKYLNIKKLSTIFNVSIDCLLCKTPDVFVDEVDKESLDISLNSFKCRWIYRYNEKIIEKRKNYDYFRICFK